MKSTDFITEITELTEEEKTFEQRISDIQTEYELTPEQINVALRIRDDCQKYLNTVDKPFTDYPLYRGIKNGEKLFLTKTARLKDRVPKDSSTDLHNKVNKFYCREFFTPGGLDLKWWY